MNLLEITFDYGDITLLKGKFILNQTKTLRGTGSVETLDDLFFINNKFGSIVVIAGSWITNISHSFHSKNYYIHRDKEFSAKIFYDRFVGAKSSKEAEQHLIDYNEYIVNKTIHYIESVNKERKKLGYSNIIFDAITTPTSWFTIIASLRLSHILGIPLISTLHVNERELQNIESFRLPRSDVILKYDQITKEKSDYMIAKNKQILNCIRPINKNVIEINNDIIPYKTVTNGERDKSVVYVGRLSFEKGIDRLRNLAKHLQKKGIDLHICGESLGLDPKINVIINEMKRLNNVRFYGFLGKNDLYDVLSKTRIIILLSRTEAFNQAILEGAMLGCIPMSTDVGAARDIIFETKNIINGIDENEIIHKFENRICAELHNPQTKHNKIMKVYAQFGEDKNKIKKFNYIKRIIND